MVHKLPHVLRLHLKRFRYPHTFTCTWNPEFSWLLRFLLSSQMLTCTCMFRWSGRNHREKIGVHVQFEQELNMEPYCCKDSSNLPHPQHFLYQLSAVVMHHGKGFGSGHYTAFCYNTEGGKTFFFSSAMSEKSSLSICFEWSRYIICKKRYTPYKFTRNGLMLLV